jgi:Tol biopolymer transport system component
MSKAHAILSAGMAVLTALAPSPGAAGICTPNLKPQPLATLPNIPGRIVFQATDPLGQTHLYGYDFANPGDGRVQLDANWGLIQAINPNFSPDGKWIVFTGTSSSCSGTVNIFAFRVGGGPLNALYPCDTNAREDARFTPNGAGVVFKYGTSKTSHNAAIAPVTLNADGTATVGALTMLTSGAVEVSAPSLSPTGKYLYYFKNSGMASSIYRLTVSAGAEIMMTQANNGAYYPVAMDLTTLLYVRHTRATKLNDQVFYLQPSISGNTEIQMHLNDCNVNNSDPAPLDEDYIVFSRPPSSASSNYTLFVGAFGSSTIWSLAPLLQSNSQSAISNLLGASYSARR